MSVAALKGKASPIEVLQLCCGGCCLGSFPQSKLQLFLSKATLRGILAIGSQGIPQSYTAQQTSHKRFIGRDTRRWLPLLGGETAGNGVGGKLSWWWSFPGWKFLGRGLVRFGEFSNPEVCAWTLHPTHAPHDTTPTSHTEPCAHHSPSWTG